MHCPSWALFSALPLYGCSLHCPFRAVLCTASLRLCSVLPLWAVVYTTSLGLCSALPLCGYALNCPSGAVLCTAPLGLCFALPL